MNTTKNQDILFTDFYQLTMAQLYFRYGLHEQQVQFDYFFRTYPDYGIHKTGYCIFAGLEQLLQWLQQSRISPREIEYLRNHRSSSGRPLFSEDFLAWINTIELSHVSINSISEGRVVHPHEPLMAVRGPLAIAQIIESALLNKINFQTLIATKASRIKEAGEGRPLIEFGLRRAPDYGADAATRAALIGGADSSSNTAISYALGYQPKGTHAHSMVQLFVALHQGELAAFRAYADLYPDDCILLVDTINTLESGVPNAIRVFEELQRSGHRPGGIRLDSGDLAFLCIRSAQMLDKAGFPDTSIVLSNNIDELVLIQVLRQIREESVRYGINADSIIARLVYGVGSKLVLSQGSGPLDGVYKLAALKHKGTWEPALKISDTPEKILTPGIKQVWRLYDKSGIANADIVAVEHENPDLENELMLYHPVNRDKSRSLRRRDYGIIEPLLVPAFDNGNVLNNFLSLKDLRANRDRDIFCLDPGVKRMINPHVYHVSLTRELDTLKQRLIAEYHAGE